MRRPKAVVAMSGGVDSSVSAALLKEDGFEVTGVMLKLWRGEVANSNSGCCNVGAAEDARRVADVLDIRFYVLNFAERFEDSVIRDFHLAYADGRTPNPCVRCNQWIKFGTLMDKATALGADVLATGHYARVRREGDRYKLLRGNDPHKDQSYVLWMLRQDDLSRCRFPVGDLNKTQTRALAAELGLRTATKPDSQEICFVREGNLSAYVDEHLPEASAPGPILSGSGEVLGRHDGVARYTIGQRRGLGLSLGAPVYVTAIDADSNSVTVGDVNELNVGGLAGEEVSFVGDTPEPGTRVLIQHRAHGEVHPGVITRAGPNRVVVEYERPVRAVAPGQSAAFYSDHDPDELLGGCVIAQTLPVGEAALTSQI